MYSKPEPSQFQQLKALPRDKPFDMVNLVRLKPVASYKDNSTVTGAEDFLRYSDLSAPIFQRVGGEIIWRGSPSALVIGPLQGVWDIAFIARYPNAGAFFELATAPEYAFAFEHREAAVADSRLIRCETSDGPEEKVFFRKQDLLGFTVHLSDQIIHDQENLDDSI